MQLGQIDMPGKNQEKSFPQPTRPLGGFDLTGQPYDRIAVTIDKPEDAVTRLS